MLFHSDESRRPPRKSIGQSAPPSALIFTVPFDAMEFDARDSFGQAVAARYDDAPRGDESAAVARLAVLAGEGPVLELAVGTGRLALPLAATGLRVDGVELSEAMIERLRIKPGGYG